MLLDDYAGPYDTGFHLTRLSRDALAVMAREWLLHGHLQDRVGIPLLFERGAPREVAQEVAIDEWAAASPIYSKRMQDTLGFNGDTVDVILKNIQLDIGAPPQYMDFQLRLVDGDHGEFSLGYCGALMDVEPMGEDWVRGMCHTIEDPTFDATAAATNPRARMSPIHRPPRMPADRMPHCQWRIDVVPDAEPAQAHSNTAIMRESLLAALPVSPIRKSAEPGGMADYSGPFAPDLQLEDFSHGALVAILIEVALQSHLLLRGYLLSLAQRFGDDVAAAAGPRVLAGVAPVTAGRLRRALGIEGDGADAIAKVLQLFPTFRPRSYVDARVELVSSDRVRLAFGPSPIFDEPDGFTWLAGLGGDGDRALDALVRGVNPSARCRPCATEGDELFAYEASVDPAAEPAAEEPETVLARFSGAASFEFTRVVRP
jgi:hypothetical protein